MKIVSEPPQKLVKPCEMKDGEIGVIERWGAISEYNGRIVQRFGSQLVSLGMHEGKSWPNCDDRSERSMNDGTYLIRILPAGTVIEL